MSETLLVVAAHPDDEIAGCANFLAAADRRGARLPILYGIAIQEWREPEARAVLAQSGLRGLEPVFLNLTYRAYRDPEALWAFFIRFRNHLIDFDPDRILTPAWEGGNFHHDLMHVLTVWAAPERERVFEYPMYNNHPLYWPLKLLRRVCGLRFRPRFLPGGPPADLEAGDDMALKIRLLRAYESQNEGDLLVRAHGFPDRARRVPDHDYTRRPHPGPLGYERARDATFAEFRDALAGLDARLAGAGNATPVAERGGD